MHVAITGATGMIGVKLTDFLLSEGHQVEVLTRRSSYRSSQTTVIRWDPELSYLEKGQLEGFDVVIHLAGSSIARYWTAGYKKNILESRALGTSFLCECLARAPRPPKLLICASAVGIYGNRPPQEILDEDSPSGEGFLADVCRQWEQAANPALKAGIRVVHMRLGVVLSRTGGALAKMLPAFQWGAGGRLGAGDQMMSWVALDEIPLVVDHLINNEKISGAVNVVSPQAVSNARFTSILGQVMRRPTMLSVPAFAVRLAFGEMGQNLLLEGANVFPRRLKENGYQFRFADLKEVLKKIII
ncbi:MAG: TIGR01777 family oxidoreductase [Candidatus Omnitrophica bacterium]|nr:TIGR01777 family oxidoreductase [Candidatus Omnitrophota bacterium]MDE2008866.1 TIGR01777 family oxidoreductase [Candidatus Omnitrophota bacterium]MDE2213571.1 TIGR01777 family oxidoreductase [Candidatus Omnitrophota bacterium]MDE2230528.1 TIGR01777 family oxidoreductase [Candidatus Omnitrophota bacterium]